MGKTSGNIKSNPDKYNSSSEARKREGYVKAMQPLLKKNVVKPIGNGESIKIKFTIKGNKHIVDDILKGKSGLTKKDLPKLDSYLREAKYESSAGLKHPRKDDIVKFYYFRDRNKNIRYHVAEKIYKHNGIEHIQRFLYAITKE